MKQVKKLIEFIKDFQVLDLLGFASILGVQEDNDFEKFVSSILESFMQQSRKKRKELLKFAEDIAANNRAYDKAAGDSDGD